MLILATIMLSACRNREIREETSSKRFDSTISYVLQPDYINPNIKQIVDTGRFIIKITDIYKSTYDSIFRILFNQDSAAIKTEHYYSINSIRFDFPFPDTLCKNKIELLKEFPNLFEHSDYWELISKSEVKIKIPKFRKLETPDGEDNFPSRFLGKLVNQPYLVFQQSTMKGGFFILVNYFNGGTIETEWPLFSPKQSYFCIFDYYPNIWALDYEYNPLFITRDFVSYPDIDGAFWFNDSTLYFKRKYYKYTVGLRYTKLEIFKKITSPNTR